MLPLYPNYEIMNTDTAIRKQVLTREDLFFIVNTFYKEVRKDEVLGPMFNTTISDWEQHLEKITDFWSNQIFDTRVYKGHPMQAHVEFDKKMHYSITPTHFGTWLFYWINTINTYYEGANAELLKDRARKMQTVLYLKMFEHRPQKSRNKLDERS